MDLYYYHVPDIKFLYFPFHFVKIERNVVEPSPVKVVPYIPATTALLDLFQMSHSIRPLLSQYID